MMISLKLGNPYPVESQLRSGNKRMRGMAPFSKYNEKMQAADNTAAVKTDAARAEAARTEAARTDAVLRSFITTNEVCTDPPDPLAHVVFDCSEEMNSPSSSILICGDLDYLDDLDVLSEDQTMDEWFNNPSGTSAA